MKLLLYIMCDNILTGSCQIFSCFYYFGRFLLDVVVPPPLSLLPFSFRSTAFHPFFFTLLNSQFNLGNCISDSLQLTTLMLMTPSFNPSLLSFRFIFPTIPWTFSSECAVDPLNSTCPFWTNFISQTFSIYLISWLMTYKPPSSLSQSYCHPFSFLSRHTN